VQVPPFGAIVSQVLAVTLNGGVAAGAVVNEIGAALSLTSVTLCAELTASADTCPRLIDFGVFSFGARPLPFSLIVRTPYEALLFNCNCPIRLPFALGTNATPIVHEAPDCSTAGQLLEVTTNPLLTVGSHIVTGVVAAVLITVTFAALLWWPTT